MRKFTFITLMMILGMSSVSLGKSYLCISEIGKFIDKSDGQYESSRITPKKIIIKTEDNDNRMVSVKKFGEGSYFCKDGEEGEYQGGINVSIKGGNFLTCRVPFKKEYGGHTYKEFNLDFRFLRFILFTNFDNSKEGLFGNLVEIGKCEEI